MKKAWLALAMMVACGALADSKPPAPSTGISGINHQDKANERDTPASDVKPYTTQSPAVVVNASPTQSIESASNTRRNEKEHSTSAEWSIAGATAALAAITLFLAIFTGLLWNSTKDLVIKTEAAAKNQSRAFIFIDGFDAPIYTLDEQEGEEPGKCDLGNSKSLEKALIPTYFSVRPRWKNSGSTPTKNMMIKVNRVLLDGGIQPDFAFGYENAPEPHFVGPNAIEASKSIDINPGVAQQVIMVDCGIGGNGNPKNPFLIIWGCAEYRDVFNRLHFVKWCYRIGFTRAPGKKLSASFTQWGEYNRTDEDGA